MYGCVTRVDSHCVADGVRRSPSRTTEYHSQVTDSPTPPASARRRLCRVPPGQAASARWLLIAVVALGLIGSRHWMYAALGRSLVCEPSRASSDAILIENYGTDYLLFERARDLRRAQTASRVLVPIGVDDATNRPNDVAVAFADVMARLSRLGSYDIVPTREVEPISLNVARDVRRFLLKEGIRSVVVVSPLFRSRRSALVYQHTLAPVGIVVHCDPARSTHGVDDWPATWHGVQDAAEQWLKLQYYRFYVLPLLSLRRVPLQA